MRDSRGVSESHIHSGKSVHTSVKNLSAQMYEWMSLHIPQGRKFIFQTVPANIWSILENI